MNEFGPDFGCSFEKLPPPMNNNESNASVGGINNNDSMFGILDDIANPATFSFTHDIESDKQFADRPSINLEWDNQNYNRNNNGNSGNHDFMDDLAAIKAKTDANKNENEILNE